MNRDYNLIFNQVLDPPFDQLDTAISYIETIKKFLKWDSLGILVDAERKNIIILLFDNKQIVGTLRLNLQVDEYVTFLNHLKGITSSSTLVTRHFSGEFSQSDCESQISLQGIWSESEAATVQFKTKAQLNRFVTEYFRSSKKNGRGKDFTKTTKDTVWRDSHGRCMFKGCGEKLQEDTLTGNKGNFAYLAHNIASSDNGERGAPYFSENLSNDPNNILLLCDKHHRLIDKVAAKDYPASILLAMRKEFCGLVDSLLDGLSFEPMAVYTILWPVNGQFVSNPKLKDIASSLAVIKARMEGRENCLSDCNTHYRKNPEVFYRQMVDIIECEADRILQQTRLSGHKAAIFAFGPMPALVGLGAVLGNKTEFTPMLRYRDSGSWLWPSDTAKSPFYDVQGLETLDQNADVVVCINFTAVTDTIAKKASELKDETGACIIEITALPDSIGNGAIAHPENGKQLSSYLQGLWHRLKDQYGVKRIHLLMCASNVTCFYVGQSIDLHHPELIVYDFYNEGMVPMLGIRNKDGKNELAISS